jgi:hypothetical protein
MTTSNEIVNLFNEIFSSKDGDFGSTISHLKEMGYGINYHTFEEQPGRRFITVFTKHCDLDKEENPISTGAIFDLNGKLRSYPGNKAKDYTLTPTTSVALSGEGIMVNDKGFTCSFPVSGYMYYSGTRMMLWNSGTSDVPVWRLSTSKAVNAFESKWNTEKSFGQMFTDLLANYHLTLSTFCAQLNPNCSYSFMMVHPEMHNVISSNSHGTLYLVGVYDVESYQHLNTEQVYQEMFSFFNGLVSKITTTTYGTYQELSDLFLRVANGTSVGEILTDADFNNYKVLNNDFATVHNTQCTTQNDVEGYFQIRNDPSVKDMYSNLYPNKVYGQALIEDELKKVVRRLHSLYIEKFPLKKNVGHLDKPIDVFLRHVLHNHYIQTKEKIKYEKVFELFNTNEKFVSDGLGFRQYQLYTSVKNSFGSEM